MLGVGKKLFFFFTALLIFTGYFFGISKFTVRAEQTSGGINIGFTVSSICGNGVIEGTESCDDGNLVSNDGCSSTCVKEGNPPSCTTPPEIHIVLNAATINTAKIRWTTTYSCGAGTQTFGYGIGTYANPISVTDYALNTYEANIDNLTASTTYQFKILAVDGWRNQKEEIGQFKTLSSDGLPSILNVTSTVGLNTALVSWQASDDHGISAVSFYYGTTLAYGPPIILTVEPSGIYSQSLNLVSGQVYYFKIRVVDTAGQSQEATGSFQTLTIDNTAPNIFNIHVLPGIDSCVISWNTDELANSEVKYGDSLSYGQSLKDNNLLLSHSLTLSGLLPNFLYHYQIWGSDATNNTTSTKDSTFTTLPDNVSPDPPTGFVLSIIGGAFKLDWNNPTLTGKNYDFAGVKLVRKTGSAPTSITDGTLIYQGGASTYTDNTIVSGVHYYYSLFSYDTSNNYSSGVSVNGFINPGEICNNNIDDDGDGLVDCLDVQDCASQPYCRGVENCTDGIDNDGDNLTDCSDPDCASACVILVEICNNNIDDDGDGLVDCLDKTDCQGTVYCPVVEICDNNIDDDGDRKIDCNDNDCNGYCSSNVVACNDGQDNDVDGLIDYPNDPGCTGYDDMDEYDAPPITIPDYKRLNLNEVIFSAANGQVILEPKNKVVTSLAGSSVNLSVSAGSLAFTGAHLSLKLNGANYLFNYNEQEQKYSLGITLPGVGVQGAHLEIDYGNNGFDVLDFNFAGLPYGLLTGDDGMTIPGAQIYLYKSGNLFPGSYYGQANPFSTNINGGYGWVVPNGEYYLVIVKDGYHERTTPVFSVDNNVVNKNIGLIKKIEEILVIDPDATITQNALNTAKNLTSKIGEVTALAVQNLTDVAANPEVQQVSKTVVAPVAVGAVAASTIPFLSFSELLPFLRLLFLQPLFLLGRKKRERWGQIYNALNKLPIDLAIVRLIDAESGTVLQSKVTDKNGRYAFVVEPGKYKLLVEKTGFVFPSSLLAGIRSDGKRLDIYHNEIIEVNEKDSVITVNVPLDVLGSEQKKPVRLVWQRLAHSLQNVVAIVGFILTAVSFYISPTWYIGALLFIHILLAIVFRRLSKPIKTKGWGIVYDKNNTKPVGRVVARLFNAELNKLVASQITDRKGRYYFLAGDDKYYVTFEHPEYDSLKTEVVDLTNKDTGTVAVDVSLIKNSGKILENVPENKVFDKNLATKNENISGQPVAPSVKPEVKNVPQKKEDIYG